MKKKLFTLLICAFAWIGVNAQTLTVTPSNVGGLDIPSGTTTIKLVGTFSGWNSGNLVNSDDDKATVTTIDFSEAHFTNENSWKFKGFAGLTNIIWPSDYSITAIPDEAFYGAGLTSVEIPKSVVTIGKQAFAGCTSLNTLTYENPTSVETFDEYCFYQTALTSVTIPGSAKSVKKGAFAEINALKSVTFAADCTASLVVETQAFDNSSSITDIYILTTAHIQCSVMAFEDDVTYGHGDTDRILANLHFPDTEANYFTNMTHYLDQETAANPGLLQAWLVEHARQAATLAQEGQNGWWEFVEAGGGDPDNDPSYNTGKFLMTYSHATLAHLVPDGVKAYIVNDIKKNNTYGLYEVYLKSVGVIPARTGVILYGQTNATNADGKPSLAMSIVRLATKAPGATGENATLYPDGEQLPDGTVVDLSLRRSNWEAPYDFVNEYKNYLEPTANVEGTSTPLAPYDLEGGKVSFRNFGFGHFHKTTIKNKMNYEDYAGFFRCKKGSSISSGKAYLKLAKDEFGFTGDEVELLIKKDDNYYMRAGAGVDAADIDEREEGYWKIATWTPPVDFGERNISIPAPAKWFQEPFFEEDEATGVAKIIIPVSSVDTYYNLNGQQVVNPTKGVYIKNGKKIIIK